MCASSTIVYNPDILPLIFQWLDLATLKSSRLVCKAWNEEVTKSAVLNFPNNWFSRWQYLDNIMNLRASSSLLSIRNIRLSGPDPSFRSEPLLGLPHVGGTPFRTWRGEEMFGLLDVVGPQLHTLWLDMPAMNSDGKAHKTSIQFKFPRTYGGGNLAEDLKRLLAVTNAAESVHASYLLEDPLYKDNRLWSNVAKLSLDLDIPHLLLASYLDLCENLESVVTGENCCWHDGCAETVVPKFRGALGVSLGKMNTWDIIGPLERLEPHGRLNSLVIKCQDSNSFSLLQTFLRQECCSSLKSLDVSTSWGSIEDEAGSYAGFISSNLTKLKSVQLHLRGDGGPGTVAFIHRFMRSLLELPELDYLDVDDRLFLALWSSATIQITECQALPQSSTLRHLKWHYYGNDQYWDARVFKIQPTPWPNLARLTLEYPTLALLNAVFQALPRLQTLEIHSRGSGILQPIPWDSILGGAPIPEPQSDYASLNYPPGSEIHYLTNLKELKSLTLTIDAPYQNRNCSCWRLSDFFLTNVLLLLKGLQFVDITGHKFTDAAVMRTREELPLLTGVVLERFSETGAPCSGHAVELDDPLEDDDRRDSDGDNYSEGSFGSI